MSIWSWLRGGGHDGSAAHRAAMADEPRHNPATGLPMMGGIGIDTLGNSYGMRSSLGHDSWTSTSSSLSHDAFRSSFDPNRGW